MVIFISGPMTGKPDYNRPAFFDAEKKANKRRVYRLNPAHFPDGLSHEAYMQVCEAMIDRSDAIYQLPLERAEAQGMSTGMRSQPDYQKVVMKQRSIERWKSSIIKNRHDARRIN